MPTKELTKEKQIEVLMENLKKCMIADMKAGKNILNAGAKKKKTHEMYMYAKQELDDFKKDYCF